VFHTGLALSRLADYCESAVERSKMRHSLTTQTDRQCGVRRNWRQEMKRSRAKLKEKEEMSPKGSE